MCFVLAPLYQLNISILPDTGNQEIFVQESTRMLADRLLNKSDFNVEQDTVRFAQTFEAMVNPVCRHHHNFPFVEKATLERLKLRFGDLAMHNNSVMLKDVDDSRRVNALVKSAIDKEGEVRWFVTQLAVS